MKLFCASLMRFIDDCLIDKITDDLKKRMTRFIVKDYCTCTVQQKE